MEKLEQCLVHPDCDIDVAEWVMRLKPFIMSINERYSENIYVDLSRIHKLFDDKKLPIKERWNSEHAFWTAENPLPLNVIADDSELLALWPTDPNSQPNAIFPQKKETVKWAMEVRNKNKNNIIIVCQGSVEVQTPEGPRVLPTMTFFSMQFFEEKKALNIILNLEPNSKYGWYCRNCSKELITQMRCSKCAPTRLEETQDNISKPGSYYCNVECQKADWTRHKSECRKN